MNFFDKTDLNIFSELSQYKIKEIEKQLNRDLSPNGDFKHLSVSSILKNGGEAAKHLKSYLSNIKFSFYYIAEPASQFDLFYGLVNDGVNMNEAWSICIKQSPDEYSSLIKKSSYLAPLIGQEIRKDNHRRNFLKSIMTNVALERNNSSPDITNFLYDISIQSIFGVINVDEHDAQQIGFSLPAIKDLCSTLFDDRKRKSTDLWQMKDSIDVIIEEISSLVKNSTEVSIHSLLTNIAIYNYAARMYLKRTHPELICHNIADAARILFGSAHNDNVTEILVRQALVNVACALPICLPHVKPSNNEVMGIFEETTYNQQALSGPFKKIMSGPIKNFMSSQMRLERIAQFSHYMSQCDYSITFDRALNTPIGKTMLIADLLDLQGGESKTLLDLIENRNIEPETLSKLASRISVTKLSEHGFSHMWKSLLNYYLQQKPTNLKERQKLRRLQQSAVHLLNVHLDSRGTPLQSFVGSLISENILTTEIYDLLKLQPDDLKSFWSKTPSVIKKHALMGDLEL